MSSTAANTPATASDPTPAVTWRDAVTPLSRASRRRWTICYALLLALAAASLVDDRLAVGTDGSREFPLVLLAALLVVFGMLRRGTRRITALDHPDLDERDIEARNSAYRVAFPLLGVVAIAGLVLLAISVPDVTRTICVDPTSTEIRHGWFVETQSLRDVGLWIALWTAFLPTGALAWREPDALDLETGDGPLAEPIRDALLGLALAGGIAADLVTNHDIGFLALVASLALLGGLARRASGQPMMSRQRKWRVAIGLVLLLIVVAIGIGVSSSGGESDGDAGGSTTTR